MEGTAWPASSQPCHCPWLLPSQAHPTPLFWRLEEHTPGTAEPTAQLAEGTGPWGSLGDAGLIFTCPEQLYCHVSAAQAKGCGTGHQPVHLPLPAACSSPKRPAQPPWHSLKHLSVQEAERSCLLQGAGHWQKQTSKM